MAKKHYGRKAEDEYRRKEQVEREVLAFLAEHDGHYNYDVLYVHFDEGKSGSIGTILQGLIEYDLVRKIGTKRAFHH